MRIKILFTLILAGLLAGCGSGSTNNQQPAATNPPAQPAAIPTNDLTYYPAFEEDACPFTLPQGFVEGKDVECGYLVVPENRSLPDGKQIRLAAAYFHRLNADSVATPVVYVEGGPGASSLEPLSLVMAKFMPLLQGHDVIFYDQRGVGFSEPALDCPAYPELDLQLLETEYRDEETASLILAATAECRQTFEGQGIDLSMYNTQQSAADLADLRLALRIESWDIYAISYGTKVVLETMRAYPDGIRSVVLDSPVPLEADPLAETVGNAMRALNVLFAACQQDAACSQAYPDLENTFYNVAALLEMSPVQLPVTNLLTGEQFNSILDGDVFIGIILKGLYSAEIIPLIPQIIAETAQGNYTKMALLRSNFLASADFLSSGMLHTVRCNEEVSFTTAEAIRSSLAQYPRLESLFGSSAAEGTLVFDLCNELGAGTAAADQNEPVTSSIPTLVLSGKFDPATPPAWGQQVADQLENSTYFEFEAVGHGPSLSHPCPNGMMLAFLNNPTQTVDNACMANMAVSFVLPARLEGLTFTPVEIPEYGLHAVVPEDWYAVKPEYYVSTDQTIELVVAENRDETVEAFKAKWNASDLLGTATYNEIEWEIYPFALPENNKAGFMAVSESDGGFYLVLIVGPQNLQAEMYASVFLQVLESVTITD